MENPDKLSEIDNKITHIESLIEDLYGKVEEIRGVVVKHHNQVSVEDELHADRYEHH